MKCEEPSRKSEELPNKISPEVSTGEHGLPFLSLR